MTTNDDKCIQSSRGAIFKGFVFQEVAEKLKDLARTEAFESVQIRSNSFEIVRFRAAGPRAQSSLTAVPLAQTINIEEVSPPRC